MRVRDHPQDVLVNLADPYNSTTWNSSPIHQISVHQALSGPQTIDLQQFAHLDLHRAFNIIILLLSYPASLIGRS